MVLVGVLGIEEGEVEGCGVGGCVGEGATVV